jgi:hypothetical protein
VDMRIGREVGGLVESSLRIAKEHAVNPPLSRRHNRRRALSAE